MQNNLDPRVKFSLKELEIKDLVRLPSGFGGFNPNDMETGWNRIFLVKTAIENKGKSIRLFCRTANGSDVSASIRSDDGNLLEKINDMLSQVMLGKSISDIYTEKAMHI